MLTFVYFRIEKEFDFVRVYDGYSYSSGLAKQLTGTIDVPYELSSSGSKLLLVFYSDFSETLKGLKVICRRLSNGSNQTTGR